MLFPITATHAYTPRRLLNAQKHPAAQCSKILTMSPLQRDEKSHKLNIQLHHSTIPFKSQCPWRLYYAGFKKFLIYEFSLLNVATKYKCTATLITAVVKLNI